MTIKEIFQKFVKKDEVMEQAEREDKAIRTIERRSKTPNEREVEFRLEQKRQEQINEMLKQMKDEERKGMLKSELMNTHNVFAGQGNDMLKQKTIFKGGSYLLK